MKLFLTALMLLGCTVLSAQAQEATASKALDTTESMLSRRVEVLRALMEDMGRTVSENHQEMTAMKVCNARGMMYAPTTAGHDAQGCVAVSPPAGTVCGSRALSEEYGRAVYPCMGRYPPDCPPGYGAATAPIKGGRSGQSVMFCFKQ